MLLVAITSLSLAAELRVPEDYDTLADALSAASATQVDTILLNPNGLDSTGNAWRWDSESGVVINKDVIIVGDDSGAVSVPNMSIARAEVQLENLHLRNGTSYRADDLDGDGVDDNLLASVVAYDSTLTLLDVEIDSAEGVGSVIVIDGELYAEGLYATGFEEQAPLYLFSLRSPGLTASITGLALEDNAFSGIYADGDFNGVVTPLYLTLFSEGLRNTFTRNTADRGGAIHLENGSTLELQGVDFYANSANTLGGAVYAESLQYLVMEDVLVSAFDPDSGDRAVSSAAAALAMSGGSAVGIAELNGLILEGLHSTDGRNSGGTIATEEVALSMTDVTAYDLSSKGGVLLSMAGGQLQASELDVEGFYVEGQGALLMLSDVLDDGDTPPTVSHSRFCQGVSGVNSTLLLRTAGSNIRLHHNVIHALTEGVVISTSQADAEIVHNSFVYNRGSVLLQHNATNLSAWNNLFKTALMGVSVVDAYQTTSLEGDTNLWFNLTEGEVDPTHSSLPGYNAVLGVDPELFDLVEGDCSTSPWLSLGSPAEDAGTETAYGLDPDGSPPDIGAYGGRDAAQPPDADSDGFDYRTDCDDADAGAYPGAEEQLEDGVDNDCDGIVDEGGHTGLDDTGGHSGLDDTGADDSGPHSALDDSGAGVDGAPRALSGGCSAQGGGGGLGSLILLLGLLVTRRSALT